LECVAAFQKIKWNKVQVLSEYFFTNCEKQHKITKHNPSWQKKEPPTLGHASYKMELQYENKGGHFQ
jgi:hypothetical protein